MALSFLRNVDIRVMCFLEENLYYVTVYNKSIHYMDKYGRSELYVDGKLQKTCLIAQVDETIESMVAFKGELYFTTHSGQCGGTVFKVEKQTNKVLPFSYHIGDKYTPWKVATLISDANFVYVVERRALSRCVNGMETVVISNKNIVCN